MCAHVCLETTVSKCGKLFTVNLGEADMGFLVIGFKTPIKVKLFLRILRKGLRGAVEVGQRCVLGFKGVPEGHT